MPKTRLAAALATALFTMSILTGCAQPPTPTDSAPTVETKAEDVSPPKVTATSTPTEEPTEEPVETPVVVPVETPAEAPAEAQAEPPAQAPEGAPVLSVRGTIVKTVGERFGLGEADSIQATFYVTAITVDPACSGPYAQIPEQGHLVRLDVEGSVDPSFTYDVWLGGGDWKVIDQDGFTVNGSPMAGVAYSCLTDSERIPGVVGAGESVRGSVVLEVPTPTGVIILGQPGLDGGWEWAYGQ